MRVTAAERDAIATAAAAADLSIGRFLVERALDESPRSSAVLQELFAVRRLLRETDAAPELMARLARVSEALE